jgi:hypothetical protein
LLFRLVLFLLLTLTVGSIASYYFLPSSEETIELEVAAASGGVKKRVSTKTTTTYKGILKSDKFKDALTKIVAKSKNRPDQLTSAQRVSIAEGRLDGAERSSSEQSLEDVFTGTRPYDKILERMIIASAYHDSIPHLQEMISSYVSEMKKNSQGAFDNIELVLENLSIDDFPQDRADFIQIATSLPGMKESGAKLALLELKRFNYPVMELSLEELNKREQEFLRSADLQTISLMDTYATYLKNSGQSRDMVFQESLALITSQDNQQLRERYIKQYLYHYPQWRERLVQALEMQE